MPVVIAPQYQDSQVGAIAKNLGTAIYGDPDARMRGAYYNSEVQKNQAETGKAGEETRGLKTKNNAMDALSNAAAQFAPLPGESAEDHIARVAPLFGTLLQAGGGNATELANGLNKQLSTLYSMGNDDQKRTALVIDGKMPDENFAGTDARGDLVANNKAIASNNQARGVANIGAASAANVANINNKGRLDQLFATPIKSAPGETTQFAPNDPRFGKVGDAKGVVTGVPTKVTVEGQAGTKMLAGDKNPTLATLYTGMDKVPNPKSVPPAEVQKIAGLAVGKIGGITVAGDPATSAANANAFMDYYGKEKISAAQDAAATEMARSGNGDAAAQAYLGALGLKPGDTFNHPGAMSRLFTGAQTGITPAAAPVAAAPAAAPVHPAQIPPAQRQLGMTVQSPRGTLVWTEANGQRGWALKGQQ